VEKGEPDLGVTEEASRIGLLRVGSDPLRNEIYLDKYELLRGILSDIVTLVVKKTVQWFVAVGLIVKTVRGIPTFSGE
jgi:hypothetical protein